ncbi:MBL fold metallo-hydrolase [Glaciecola sp. MH2013]|uniref:MBL fold metallo-hydrolase n=1 Tax=Glaciecola sp. MH2013 TaxID=2785524 RepID=UPI00189D51E9|nr:MBL fold metallo-hydrolase [Glaciecola sp. MH2013]MBF7073710.1 MBL fold metallo-hydrolase [Glaciecola sp. MH2013]
MKVHVLQGFIQNIFLVEYPDKCMLLDGCARADFNTIEAFFREELKRPLSDLKVVIVTHMHPDHAGCAHYLRARTNCLVIAANRHEQWYSGISGRFSHLVDIALAFWVAGKLKRKKQNIYYSPKLSPDLRILNKARVPGFNDWQILETPGHTDRDLSVMHLPSKRIYVADLIVRVKQKYSAPYPVHLPTLYRASLQLVAELQPRSVMMAHAPEAHINQQEFNDLIASAPTEAANNSRAVKRLLKKLIFRKRHAASS